MRKNYTAVVQAGGKGTRMLELTKDLIPKPLLQLNGKPMIQWQIENVRKYGIREFVIILGHLGEKIEEYFGDGNSLDVHISYIYETEPLGSAGALYYLKSQLKTSDFLLIYGDVMFDVDWHRMISFHENKNGLATLLVHPNSHPFDSDLVILDDEQCVIAFDSKTNHRDYWYDNCVNSGLYILSKDILNVISEVKRLDLEKDILKNLLEKQKVYGYLTPEYVKDAGTPERFLQVEKAQCEGVWGQKCLQNKQKCIFLDRDGTVNQFRGLVSREDEFVLEQSVADAVRLINESGYLAIVVTNQPVVARGMCDIDDVKRIHQKMQVLLGEQGVYLDDIVFCPHHPDKGYPEENPIYKISCNCRKPAIGMIEQMIEKYNIDLSESYMIGDSTVDIQTGINAGLRTILLETGQAGKDKKYDVQPTHRAKNLLEAVKMVLDR